MKTSLKKNKELYYKHNSDNSSNNIEYWVVRYKKNLIKIRSFVIGFTPNLGYVEKIISGPYSNYELAEQAINLSD